MSERSNTTRLCSFKAGFTLIELLIVVAIIAVLAAIAVPNFLEAQTRAKVSRTKTDLRTISTALETYRVDNNKYYLARLYQSLAERLTPLTTPIAYLSAILPDPFYKRSDNFAGLEGYYCYVSGNIYGGQDTANEDYAASIYTIAGRGPDGHYNFGGICTAHPLAVASQAYERGSYDPTNGTVSEGDVIRLCSNSLGAAQ